MLHGSVPRSAGVVVVDIDSPKRRSATGLSGSNNRGGAEGKHEAKNQGRYFVFHSRVPPLFNRVFRLTVFIGFFFFIFYHSFLIFLKIGNPPYVLLLIV